MTNVGEIIMDAAKTAAQDLRSRTGDLYELTLMGMVPAYIAAQLPLMEFAKAVMKGFGKDAHVGLKCLLLAFVWEATWTEAGEKQEELPKLFEALRMKDFLNNLEEGEMYHVSYDETGIGFIHSKG